MQFTPWLFPPAAVSVLWILIYQDQYGLLNEVLRFIGLSSWATNWLGMPGTALAAVTIASIWNLVSVPDTDSLGRDAKHSGRTV